MGRSADLVQGVVCWADLPQPAGRRPVLILTRSDAISRLAAATAAPLTRTVRGIRSEVALTPEQDGVKSDCAVSIDNILTIPKSMLGDRVTTLSKARMEQVFEAVRYAFAMP